MLSRYLGSTFVYKISLFLYATFAFALSFNKVILSLATILLVLICALDIDKAKYKTYFSQNKVIHVLLVFLGIHLLSFFVSDNTAYFFKDLNSKLPLYLIPICLVLKPLEAKKDYYLIFAVFLSSLAIFSIWNYISFYHLNYNEFEDLRNMSLFTSHIRFGLMLVFGIVILLYWIFKTQLKYKFIACIILVWFLTYTYYAEVFNAYLALFFVCIAFTFSLLKQSRFKKILVPIFALICLASSILVFVLIKDFFQENKVPKLESLPVKTAEGNPYTHFLDTRQFINGNHTYSCISEVELTREWNKQSKFDIKDSNQFGYLHYYILIQYMASKGLKKDAVGFKQLTKEDIKNIEKGKINYLGENFGFYNRLQSLRDEFSDNDPNGKTVKQRIEYLKCASEIFSKHLIFGVGSGDLDDVFQQTYAKNKSKLSPENRLRAHNQLFTYFISFGIIGGLIFCYLIFSAFRLFFKEKIGIALFFMCIILISFFSEDTLETQVGATFFAFFLGLMISSGNKFLKLTPHEN